MARRSPPSPTLYAALALLLAAGLIWMFWATQKPTSRPRPKLEAPAPSREAMRPHPAKQSEVITPPATNLPLAGAPIPPGPPTNLALLPPPIPESAQGADPTRQELVQMQIGLVQRGISPGPLDGRAGSQTVAALRAFQMREGLPQTGLLDTETKARLRPSGPTSYLYQLTTDDFARLTTVPSTWLAKSQQRRLDYESILEMLAERSQSHPDFVRRLNPGMAWDRLSPGAFVRLADATFPPSSGRFSEVRIYLSQRMLQGFDERGRLVFHAPCSIAQRVDKRPIGKLFVSVVAPDPNYTFDPEVFPESAEGRALGRKLVLPPGPNNPVGVAWVGLNRPGYGIHGTPRPEEVGRTESHGCFRLANWNAEYFLRGVQVGTPVVVEP